VITGYQLFVIRPKSEIQLLLFVLAYCFLSADFADSRRFVSDNSVDTKKAIKSALSDI